MKGRPVVMVKVVVEGSTMAVVVKTGNVVSIVCGTVVNVGYAVKEAHWWRDKVVVLSLLFSTKQHLPLSSAAEYLMLSHSPRLFVL